MKAFDSFLTWMIVIAIVAVVVGSGQTDAAIKSVTTLLSSLIGVIVAPPNSK